MMVSTDIDQAVRILRAGGLVAFPTETVYGLGADATNSKAIAKIFQAKGRPTTNPLIVHAASAAVARRYASAWPTTAVKLARAFWPGPLTLVLPKATFIVPEVTAGKSTVGLRCPNHPLTLELLEKFDGPLAGPSANRSTHISPTTAQHVKNELGGGVDLILDGGACAVGIESTVIDLSVAVPIILRPGEISRAQIEKCIGSVGIFSGSVSELVPAISPGQHERHYAPTTPAYRFESNETHYLRAWCDAHMPRPVVILSFSKLSDSVLDALPLRSRVDMPLSSREYARRLYADLHDADEMCASAIWIEMPPDEPQWHAVRDRIRRATRPAYASA